MRNTARLPERQTPANDRDPREQAGAEVIDLATRNVLPTVTQRKPRAEGLGLAAGIGVVALLGVATLWSMDSARNAQPQQPAAGTAPTTVTPALPGTAPQAAPTPQPAPAPAPGQAPAPGLNASPTVVFDASALPEPLAPAGTAAAPAPGDNSNDAFASRIGGVGGSKATAEAAFNPRTTVSQGTLIPAILETAIDTDVPGYVRAVVSTDVRSFDGTRVLVPRSSRLIGQYKSGLQAGQKRAYVIWTRLIRPDGVSVNIASPAVSFGGETGLAGKVSSHFFERFGSAMLLSVVGGLSAITGNANVVIAGGGQSAAAAAVSQNGQIGPTIRVRQGEPIRVFTARDLDFSRVSAE